jgi:hypothetical protein
LGQALKRVRQSTSKIVGTIFLCDRRDGDRFHRHRVRNEPHGVGDVESLAYDGDDAFVEAREQGAKEPIRSILMDFHVVGIVGAH